MLRQAETFASSLGSAAADATAPCDPLLVGQLGAAGSNAPGSIVPLPVFPGESIDERLVADVALLGRRFRIHVTDGYAATGHAADGGHPLGLALDIVPGPRGSWEDIDELARWAEPRQNAPRPPWRWVGYDGDSGHGRGHHLHLSWEHGPGRPASWVDAGGPLTQRERTDEREPDAAVIVVSVGLAAALLAASWLIACAVVLVHGREWPSLSVLEAAASWLRLVAEGQ